MKTREQAWRKLSKIITEITLFVFGMITFGVLFFIGYFISMKFGANTTTSTLIGFYSMIVPLIITFFFFVIVREFKKH